MKMAEQLNDINVVIADRPYPLRVNKRQEADVRKAAGFINEKVRELQHKYDAKDKQDFLAMILLMNMVDSVAQNTNDLSSTELNEQLQRIDGTLHQLLA